MTADQDHDILPASEPLAAFDPDDRRILTGYGNFVDFKADKILVKEGERQESLYVLVSGVLHAVHKIRGGLAPLGTIKSGEWFGEINILDPQEATATCVAHMAGRAWYIDRNRLEQFLNEHPGLGCMLLLGVAEVLAKRARGLIKKVNATWEISY